MKPSSCILVIYGWSPIIQLFATTLNYQRWRRIVTFTISFCGKYQMAALWVHLTKIEMLEHNLKLFVWSIKYISFSQKPGNIVKITLKLNKVADETVITNRNVVEEIPLHVFRLIKWQAVAIKRYFIFGGLP